MFFVTGTSWQLGVLLLILANLCLGGSLVVYDSLLCRIAAPDERDRVSSRGWALGYLGGGLLLALNLVLVTLHDRVGLSEGGAVRVSLLSAGLWWAAFTLIPVLGLRDLRGTTAAPVDERAGVVGGSLRQLGQDLRRAARLPADAAVPAGLPVLQRRHPDGDHLLQPVRRRAAAASARAS